MSLDTFVATRPNSKNGGSDPLELVIEEFTGMVEGTIQRRSATEGWLPIRSVKGTATITNYAVGESKLGKVVPGVTPDGVKTDFSKASVTVDTLVYARAALPLLDTFQTQFDVRKEIANEHGKKIAKLKDEAFLIQGIKAAQLTASPFGATDGHQGGSVVTLSAAGDENDPAKLYAAFADLFTKMEEKDVDVINDNIVVFVRPKPFYTLMQSEQVVNGEYLTADGTSVKGRVFAAWGVPVKSTNNLPNTNITAATAGSVAELMGTSYEVDATKVVALAMAPRALLAGETIALTGDVFYDKLSKSWYVDAHLAFAAGPNRPEFAGLILKA